MNLLGNLSFRRRRNLRDNENNVVADYERLLKKEQKVQECDATMWQREQTPAI